MIGPLLAIFIVFGCYLAARHLILAPQNRALAARPMKQATLIGGRVSDFHATQVESSGIGAVAIDEINGALRHGLLWVRRLSSTSPLLLPSLGRSDTTATAWRSSCITVSGRTPCRKRSSYRSRAARSGIPGRCFSTRTRPEPRGCARTRSCRRPRSHALDFIRASRAPSGFAPLRGASHLLCMQTGHHTPSRVRPASSQ
jgi:hypothetical protein